MRFIRPVIILVLSLLAFSGEGASVIWNVFESTTAELDFYDDNSYYPTQKECLNIYYYGGGYVTPEICLAYNKSIRGPRLSASAVWDYVNVGNPSAIWVLATAGEVLTSLSDFQSHQLIFDCLTDFDLDASSTGTIPLSSRDQTYYLAILGNARYDSFDPYWGWVELEGNRANGLSVISSALSFDGPLVVGGGLANQTPEPTSGMLLILGTATLVLLRRRA